MAEELHTTTETENVTWQGVVGGALVIGGGLMLIDQFFHLGWVAPLSVLAGGLFLFVGGVKARAQGFVIAGSLVCGLGVGIASAFDFFVSGSVLQRVGLVILFGGVGFGTAEFSLRRFFNRIIWWPVIPFAVLVSTGACMLVTPAGILDFTLFILVGLGLAFLEIGLSHHWIGLIIPGCLLCSAGLGIYLPWGTDFGVNPLAKTGGMLVLLAFGWGLISVFSRMIMKGIIWWPLIPGGLLAVVGWGLYTGGDPSNAARFIGNTGTVAILMLGFYLLMMRRGIR